MNRTYGSADRNCDQFAKLIGIAGFTFDVLDATGDKFRLRYEIANRLESSPAQRVQIGLQSCR